MDTTKGDDRESKTEGPTQHSDNKTTDNVIQSNEDTRKTNEGNNSTIQYQERETKEVFLNDNDRNVQQTTSANEEPGSTKIQEGYYKEIQQGIYNHDKS